MTDDAKIMTGSKTGYVGQLKQRKLSGKIVKLSTAMEIVTKIINIIKGEHKFLTHQKFKLFLDKAVHINVPLHCPLRWLSAAKCLEIFFTIRKEILLFLTEMNNSKFQEYVSFLENVTFLNELAFITNMANQLRLLNLKLQRMDQDISQLVSHVDSFRKKLHLLKTYLNNNIFYFFFFLSNSSRRTRL